MIRFLAYVAGVVTLLLITCAAMAGPKKGNGNHHNNNHNNHNNHNHNKGHHHDGHFDKFKGQHGGFGVVSYHHKFGKSFGHGFYFPGKSHNHWTYSGYSPKFKCVVHWCPSTAGYYYWCHSAGCYYPVSYIQTAPPEYVPHQFKGSAGSPPPGVPALPR